jgi:RimJ/RimL family protein N-acetyltransferase
MTYLSTARLHVRRFTSADAAVFSAYRADPDVARYQSWSDFTVDQGIALVESMRHLELGTPGEWYQLALEDRSRRVLVGDLACKVSSAERREMEIGFTLAPEEQGRGYATEALQGLLDHAFTQLGLHRVVAVTDARNTTAAALLRRIGMRQEGHLVENVFFKGEWGSELLFAKLARDHDPAPSNPAPDPSPLPGGTR